MIECVWIAEEHRPRLIMFASWRIQEDRSKDNVKYFKRNIISLQRNSKMKCKEKIMQHEYIQNKFAF